MTVPVVVGFALSAILGALLATVWWQEAKRTDEHAHQIADLQDQSDRLADHLANLQDQLADHLAAPHHLHALVTHHLELLDMTDPEPSTEPIPVIEGEPTVPSDLPTQVHQALIARRPVPTPRTHTSPADDPEWRRRFGLEVQA